MSIIEYFCKLLDIQQSGFTIAKKYRKAFLKKYACPTSVLNFMDLLKFNGVSCYYKDEEDFKSASYFDVENKIIYINQDYENDFKLVNALLYITFAYYAIRKEDNEELKNFSIEKVNFNNYKTYYSICEKRVFQFVVYMLFGTRKGIQYSGDILGLKTIEDVSKRFKMHNVFLYAWYLIELEMWW